MTAVSLHALWEGLCGLLWPPRCPACDAPSANSGEALGAFCAICAEALIPVMNPQCPICGLPYDGVGPAHPCRQCIVHPPPFSATRGVLEYGGPAAIACLRFKAGKAHLARPLGRLLQGLAREIPPMDLVVPVPLHRHRLAQRGYNQAALLAAPLARALAVPLLTRGLLRVRDTASQARLDAAGRKKNLQGAFSANTRLFSGARVLLVDDVVTTTATCRAASLALREAGAHEVQVACLLRAT